MQQHFWTKCNIHETYTESSLNVTVWRLSDFFRTMGEVGLKLPWPVWRQQGDESQTCRPGLQRWYWSLNGLWLAALVRLSDQRAASPGAGGKLTRLSVLQVLATLPLDGRRRGHSLDLRVSVLLIHHCKRQSKRRQMMMILRDTTAQKRMKTELQGRGEEEKLMRVMMSDLSVRQTRFPTHLSPPARWSASGLSSGCWPWASAAPWTDSSSLLDRTHLHSQLGCSRHSQGWALNRPAPPGEHRTHAKLCWGKITYHYLVVDEEETCNSSCSQFEWTNFI